MTRLPRRQGKDLRGSDGWRCIWLRKRDSAHHGARAAQEDVQILAWLALLDDDLTAVEFLELAARGKLGLRHAGDTSGLGERLG